jgi:hypothetical protein
MSVKTVTVDTVDEFFKKHAHDNWILNDHIKRVKDP